MPACMTADWPSFPDTVSSNGRYWLQQVPPEQTLLRRRRQLWGDRASRHTARCRWSPRADVVSVDSREYDVARGISAEHRTRSPHSSRGRTTTCSSRRGRPVLCGTTQSPVRMRFATYSTYVRIDPCSPAPMRTSNSTGRISYAVFVWSVSSGRP